MRNFVYPYLVGSKSALAIADGLDCLMLKVKSPYKAKAGDLVVNWGNGVIPEWNKPEIEWLNHPSAVTVAANKKKTFLEFAKEGVACPDFTSDIDEVFKWLKKGTVFARTKLTGHSGQGIVVLDKGTEEIPNAPLYVKYKKKAREFRVHVFKNEIIDVQEKRKKVDFDGERNNQIRSHDNGWVFCREGLDEYDKETLFDIALDAVSALGLDFGAVDIIYNAHEHKYYALEVNTAPGIEGETMFSYVCSVLNYVEAR